MEKARILYISQHIVPFLPATQMSSVSRNLPQAVHEKGREIRVLLLVLVKLTSAVTSSTR